VLGECFVGGKREEEGGELRKVGLRGRGSVARVVRVEGVWDDLRVLFHIDFTDWQYPTVQLDMEDGEVLSTMIA